jgi:ATP-dependent RNA helicase DDX28
MIFKNFSNKNSTSSFVTHFLGEHGVDAPCYCGNMPAILRYETFDKFQSGESTILSTTDIGSRGLNTVKVRLAAALDLNTILTILLQAQVVLNYDFPLYKADYLHRCGRVGRIDSNARGKVINFVNGPAEIKVVQAIEVTD